MTRSLIYHPPDVQELEGHRILSQAGEMRGMARTYSDMLSRTNPGFIDRYKKYSDAVRNLWRAGIDQNMSTFILFAEVDEFDPPIGVATVIRDQKLKIQPQNGQPAFEGAFTDIDYWVGKEIHPAAHNDIGEILVNHALWTRPIDPIVVSAPIGAGFPRGLSIENDFHGFEANPVQIIPVESDPYGVTRGGALVNARFLIPTCM